MANWKKLASGAAGAAGGAGLNVEDVFSTYLYTGNSSQRTITNGIDLAGEGGLVWTKSRSTQGHVFCDTAQGTGKYLSSNQTWGTVTNANVVNAFNSDGYSIGSEGDVNANTYNFASWTFRKAPKFFDVVTYTGNGTAGRTVSHNLGSVPGCIIVKRTDTSGDWAVFHRSLNGESNPAVKHLELNGTGGEGTNTGYWNDTDPTSTVFSVGINSRTNANGGSYVAYLFAHNDGDGDFGPTGDQDIIKCGVYSGNGTNDGPAIDLGFEPQWFMVRNITEGGDWIIVDNMRSGKAYRAGNLTDNSYLRANSSGAELVNQADAGFTPTGFTVSGGNFSNDSQGVGNKYIYIAIRRGPMAVPTDANDVFDVFQNTSSFSTPSWQNDILVDMGIYKNSGSSESWWLSSRLTAEKVLRTDTTNSELNDGSADFDFQTGWGNYNSSDTAYYSFAWKRAPNFFDAVGYEGTGAAQNVSHNLGAVPEMIWVKRRDANNFEWIVYHKGLNGGSSPEDYVLYLNATNAEADVAYWNDTAPTDSVFSVSGFGQTGASNGDYIAYLFASLDGISKVGSYTGDGTTNRTIDCGFSSGARFVVIKSTGSGGWYVFDTERGIVSGNDPWLQLEKDTYQQTWVDYIDPTNSGFIIGVSNISKNQFNNSGTEYIFYAIA